MNGFDQTSRALEEMLSEDILCRRLEHVFMEAPCGGPHLVASPSRSEALERRTGGWAVGDATLEAKP